MEHPEVEGYVVVVHKTLDEEARNVCLIAGVDFSHIGERFGDQGPMTDEFMSRVRPSDLDLTPAAESLDSGAFLTSSSGTSVGIVCKVSPLIS